MSELQLFNTFSKSLEKFIPQDKNFVKMYICGPTVYDSPHIGHARTYVSFDIIRRVLSEYFNYDVFFVMNITDIDDKIIKRASENNISTDELSRKFEDEFFHEMEKLNVLRPDFVTRVSEYVSETIKFTEKLEKEGFAYESSGSVYFDLKKYGENFKTNLLRPAVQFESDEPHADKKNPEDFALWKASKPGEPTYDSKWAPGRPGWHIECSAMASAIFGSKLDIHAGGIDLAFPHHENEIAQCQGFHGEKWVNYFLHTGHLNIEGLKMSKSLKNFLTIKDILKESTPENLRILFLLHFWNKDMNYDSEQLKQADAIRKKIFNFISNADFNISKKDMRMLNDKDHELFEQLKHSQIQIHQAIINNINTPKVIEEILDLISKTNSVMDTLHTDILRLIRNHIFKILKIFGVVSQDKSADSQEENLAKLLSEFRINVKNAAKNKLEPKVFYKFSDDVRDKIREFGYAIDDKGNDAVLRRI